MTPWKPRARSPKANKTRGTGYERDWGKKMRALGYFALHARGSMSDGTDIDWVIWLGDAVYFASCKDDGRGCESALNLLAKLRNVVPPSATPIVVHSRPGERFCDHYAGQPV